MRKRKLQVFLSSTYEDLIQPRLAAMEAILAAGHIPAAMEQFSPGDETAWEKIRAWIGESDCFILILGGRYGSIEPSSKKSYVHLEYEYAIETKKPFFSLVVKKEAHERRVQEPGLKVDERAEQAKHQKFSAKVTERLYRLWADEKDIKSAIFQKLPEWAQRSDLVGWIRGDEAADPEVANELARLSHENRELRSKVSTNEETFEGLTFDAMVKVLRRDKIPLDLTGEFDNSLQKALRQGGIVEPYLTPSFLPQVVRNAGDLFESIHDYLAVKRVKTNVSHHQIGTVQTVTTDVMDRLTSQGLVKIDSSGGSAYYAITDAGRRFRNRLLLIGNREERRGLVRNDDSTHPSNPPA